jgi:hypothetical protein
MTRKIKPFSFLVIGISGCWFAALLLHLGAGLYFPQPFGDESYFFYAAKSWAENSSFFAPELHSGRTLYWMPFGYPFLAGLVLKWISPEFIGLRHLSFAGVSVAFFALCGFLIREKDAGWKIALTGLFLLSKPWLVCGNLARMESWVLAFVGLAICFSRNQYYRISWFCIFLGGIFHPIGLAFAPFWLLFNGRDHHPSGYRDWLLPGLVAIPVLTVFYLGFPPDVSHILGDWQFQMAGKPASECLILLFRARSLGFFLLAGFLAFQFIRLNNRPNLLLTGLAVWLFLIRIYGRGDTYGIYTSLAMLLISVCLWDYLVLLASRPVGLRMKKPMLFSCLILLLLGSQTLHLPLAGPFPSVSRSDIVQNKTYLQPEEIQSIRHKADSVCRAKQWKTLAIYPETIGCILYQKGLYFRQIIHNFEDSRPDGILFFSAEGDSFGADRRQIYEGYHIRPETQINLGNSNWSMFPNTGKCLVRNRIDALHRCRRAGMTCPK